MQLADDDDDGSIINVREIIEVNTIAELLGSTDSTNIMPMPTKLVRYMPICHAIT